MNSLIEEVNSVWVDKQLYDEAERIYYEKLAKGACPNACAKKVSLAGEVAEARERIKQFLENVDEITLPGSASSNINVQSKLASVEDSVSLLWKGFEDLKTSFTSLEKFVKDLEKKINITPGQDVCKKPAPVCSKPAPKQDDDDDVDLFGSEDEDENEEAQKIKEQRVAEYTAKKSKKPVLIAKSNIILDVKPWDDETDMKLLEVEVRKVAMDGLIWGASKLVPLAYGIKKLQISCVVEDDKVSVDELQETIQEIEEYVQSVDIAAFNKV